MSTALSVLERQVDGITAARIHRQRMEEYHARIRPILRNMATLESMQPFQLVLHNDGTLGERQVLWNEEAKALYDQGAEMIKHIQELIFDRPLASSLPLKR